MIISGDLMNMVKEAQERNSIMIKDRRYLHHNAETGFDLHKTVKYVCKRLKQMGYKPELIGRAGVIATFGADTGKTILLRADMDALPIKEETEKEFACTNTRMHACGHDLHTAMLLGAAQLLRGQKLNGRVVFLFQPAEELLQGAKDVLDNGLIQKYKPNRGFMLHVSTADAQDSGTVIIPGEGATAPAADYFDISLHGHGAHGSMPHRATHSLLAAANIAGVLHGLIQNEVPTHIQAALSIGALQSGNAANIIPNNGLLQGSVRCFDESYHDMIKRRIVEISKSIAAAYQVSADVRFYSSCPTFLSDSLAVKDTRNAIKRYIPDANIEFAAEKSISGSEDFAFITQQIPSSMVLLCAGCKDKGFPYPLHHPKADFDENVLWMGAAIHAAVAMEYLN